MFCGIDHPVPELTPGTTNATVPTGDPDAWNVKVRPVLLGPTWRLDGDTAALQLGGAATAAGVPSAVIVTTAVLANVAIPTATLKATFPPTRRLR